MPPSYTDDQIVYAVRDGLIIPAQLDRMAQGMIDLVNKTRAAMSIDNYRFDVDAHDEVAHQAVVPEFLRTLVFARPRGDDQFADCTFSPSLDMSR